MSDDAYFCLVTWPDGREGLLFPRPGNVPINKTKEDGLRDLGIAVRDFEQFVALNPKFVGTKIRLTRFVRMEVVQEYPASSVPPKPPEPELTDEQVAALMKEPLITMVPRDAHTCGQCGRQKSYSAQGYVCEYCANIED